MLIKYIHKTSRLSHWNAIDHEMSQIVFFPIENGEIFKEIIATAN